MEFHIIDEMVPFHWSRLDVVVIGITFDSLMIKLRHTDKSWRENMLN